MKGHGFPAKEFFRRLHFWFIALAAAFLGAAVGASCSPGQPDRPGEVNDGGTPASGDSDAGSADAGPVHAGTRVTINFDDLASGPVTNQYAPAATFSTTQGTVDTLSYASYFNSSRPNIICSQGCAEPLYVDFGTPVSELSFRAVGVTDSGVIAKVRVLRNGALLGTVDIVGIGANTTPVAVSLAKFSDVTRIEVVDITDTQGIGLDDFAFTR